MSSQDPAPQPPTSDDYERDPRTRQGSPAAMRCRHYNTSKFARSLGKGIALLCPVCDGIPRRKD